MMKIFNLFNNDGPRCETRNTLRVEGVCVLSERNDDDDVYYYNC